MSLKREIKSIALRWANSSGSHSDDLLEEILDALKKECDWAPKRIRNTATDEELVAILKSMDYAQSWYRVSDQEWEDWKSKEQMGHTLRQWAESFYYDREMAKEMKAL
jgi:hypothetical protein